MRRTPPTADQHIIPLADAEEGHLDAPPTAALAAAGLFSRPEVKSAGSAGDQGDLRCRWLDGPPPRHLQGDLRSPNQRNYSASQLRRINVSDEEVADSEVLGRALQKRPQLSLRNPPHRHRPAPQVEISVNLDLPSSLPETFHAVQQRSSGKASDSNANATEIYKQGGRCLMDQLTTLFQDMWRCGQVPQNFRDTTTIHLYKRKRNR
ncbi:hypothetical protein SprV_0100186800 [Sparganum proliferum]